MSVQITIQPGYLGQCMCGKEAVHTVWCKFSNPDPEWPDSMYKLAEEADVNLPPPAKGIWHNVCDDCVKDDDTHRSTT